MLVVVIDDLLKENTEVEGNLKFNGITSITKLIKYLFKIEFFIIFILYFDFLHSKTC